MLDFQQVLYDKLPEFEGKTTWLYLDTHKPPLATVWIGIFITLTESLTLPWQVDGRQATPQEIQGDYHRVSSMPGGMLASRYRVDGCPELNEEGGAALMQKRFDAFTQELLQMYPDFLSWPVGPKAASLDMMYGLGRSGMNGYVMWRAAAARKDWKTCAAQCAMNASNPAYDNRNQWLKLRFLSGVPSV